MFRFFFIFSSSFFQEKKKVYLLSTRNKNLYHCVASTLLEFTKHTQMYICDTGLKSICTQHAIPLLHSKLFCHVLHCFTVFIFVFYCFNRINCNNIFNWSNHVVWTMNNTALLTLAEQSWWHLHKNNSSQRWCVPFEKTTTTTTKHLVLRQWILFFCNFDM